MDIFTLGTLGYYYYKKLKSKYNFQITIILVIPVYIILRISGILPVNAILDFSSSIFDADRIESLAVRLFQEEVFGKRALESPFLGWGWMGRAWPRDIATGEDLVQMIDSLYLIVFSNNGFLGLLSLYAVLLLGTVENYEVPDRIHRCHCSQYHYNLFYYRYSFERDGKFYFYSNGRRFERLFGKT